MTIVITSLFFIYGIVFGSFFNVVGLRVPKKESIVSPPSHCTTCDRKLGVLDLVPVFSYIFLKGKCQKMWFENQSHLSVYGVCDGCAVCVVILYVRF